ncbi:MAG: hypothetical protein NT018_12145 [Armatimonadetes bacterium]|nr:hypothetical protein [Armatimonadota bacterium]
MRMICSKIVEAFGSWWGMIGWFLFGFLLISAFLPIEIDMLVLTLMGVLFLFLAWWIIDIADQCVPGWMIFVGIILLVLGVITRFLTIACWVIYWTKVRE